MEKSTIEFLPLPKAFFRRDTLIVAPSLLGQFLVRRLAGQILAGRIVEVEAYVGLHDTASHASRGQTARNAVMFGAPGYAYVYLIYGMYHCLNVVTEEEGYPAAILIRAIEPVIGIEAMRNLRGSVEDHQISNGPGKLCQALAIDRRLNGQDLTSSGNLFIAAGDGTTPHDICTSPRIGVRGDNKALQAPWRFFFCDSASLSRKNSGPRRTAG